MRLSNDLLRSGDRSRITAVLLVYTIQVDEHAAHLRGERLLLGVLAPQISDPTSQHVQCVGTAASFLSDPGGGVDLMSALRLAPSNPDALSLSMESTRRGDGRRL